MDMQIYTHILLVESVFTVVLNSEGCSWAIPVSKWWPFVFILSGTVLPANSEFVTENNIQLQLSETQI